MGGDNVRPAVSVDVARANTMQPFLAGNGADVVADPLGFGKRLGALKPGDLAA